MNAQVNGSVAAYLGQEWELQEAAHASQFLTAESAEAHSGQRLFDDIQRMARATAPVAGKLAALAARSIAGAAPAAAGSLSEFVHAGELEAAALEKRLFVVQELEAELSIAGTARQIALAEVLAAEASHSSSENEAGAFLGSAVSTLVSSMGHPKALRRILPNLVAANARLVRLLYSRGIPGKRLLRLIPTILRRTLASLRAAARQGQSITSALAIQLMASHAHRVLGNSQTVTQAMIRNALLYRQTVATARSQ